MLLQLGFVYLRVRSSLQNTGKLAGTAVAQCQPMELGIFFDLGASGDQSLVVEITIRADLCEAWRR